MTIGKTRVDGGFGSGITAVWEDSTTTSGCSASQSWTSRAFDSPPRTAAVLVGRGKFLAAPAVVPEILPENVIDGGARVLEEMVVNYDLSGAVGGCLAEPSQLVENHVAATVSRALAGRHRCFAAEAQYVLQCRQARCKGVAPVHCLEAVV